MGKMVNQASDELVGVAEGWLDRWTSALRDSRCGSYSTDRFVADLVSSSADAVKLWLIPYNLMMENASEPNPLVIQVPRGQDTGSGVLRLPRPAKGGVECGPDLKDGQETLPAACVHPHLLTEDERIVVVNVTGLSDVPQGVYHGTIREKGKDRNLAGLVIERA